MSRLIDADAVIEALDSFILDEVTDVHGDTVREILERLPTIEERKTGKWIHERLASTTGGSYPIVRCSVCQGTIPMEWETHYCPHCGADMRGEGHE